VSVGGVTVHSGDFIIGDADGVVVVEREKIEGLLPAAEKKVRDEAARIAAIQAAKSTAQLIPLCHPLPLNHIAVDFTVTDNAVEIRCEVATRAATGVEMEALTGVSVAALALYDMMKAIDKSMRIEGIAVLEKTKQ